MLCKMYLFLESRYPSYPRLKISLGLVCLCNRWTIVARTQGLSLTVQTLYHWATEPPGHITNNPPPETYPGYTHIHKSCAERYMTS